MSPAWKDQPPTRGVDLRAERNRRVWWLSALDAAAEAGDLVADGGELSAEERFRMTGVAVKAGEVGFPLPFVSAVAASRGFHQLARGFVAAEVPALRAALGLAMAAAARCCRRMIEIETEQQAEAQRRRYGGD